MSATIQDLHDYPTQLAHTRRYVAKLAEAQPETMKAFGALHRAASGSGALDSKTKELIALAIGVAARCDGCIAYHTHDALHAGATRAEVMDALAVAVLMGGGPSVMYAVHVMEAMEQFGAGEG